MLAGLDLGPGDEILTSDEEHPGLLGPLAAARARGVAVRMAPLATLHEAVTLRHDARGLLARRLGRRAILAPAELAELDVPVILDGAQGAGAIAVDSPPSAARPTPRRARSGSAGPTAPGLLWLEPGFAERVRADRAELHRLRGRRPGARLAAAPAARAATTPRRWPRRSSPSAPPSLAVLAEAGPRRGPGAGAAPRPPRWPGAWRKRAATVAPRDDTTLVAWEDPSPEAARDRLAEDGIVVRNLPGRPLLRASVGAWTSDEDLDRLLAAL